MWKRTHRWLHGRFGKGPERVSGVTFGGPKSDQIVMMIGGDRSRSTFGAAGAQR